jgi:predicted ester cyclase
VTNGTEHVLSEQGLVAVKLVGRGVHAGDFFGISPTRGEVNFHGMYYRRVTGERVVEDRDVFGRLTPSPRLGASLARPSGSRRP